MATSELTLRIGADPASLQQGLRKSSESVNSFAGRTRATISKLGSSIKGAADKIATPLNAIVLGGGLGIAIKSVGDLSQSLMYYGMAAKKSDADTQVFRDSLHRMAVETGVDANTILSGISQIGEITGDFAFSEEMGESLAKAAKASGASVEELASVAASMKASMGWGADQIANSFNSLIIQGDQGSYTLQKFATEGKGLLAAASSFGIKSQDQFASFGAYLQVMNTSIKSEAELTTSVSALFNELIAKSGDLKKIGVNVFDKDKNIRDFDVIMRELMAKTGGSIQKISPMFGDSARKALVPVMAEYKNGWNKLESITRSGANGMTNTDEMEKRFQKTSEDFNTNIAKMKASAIAFADSNLAGPVNMLSNAFKTLSEHQIIVKAGFSAMAVAASALVGVKLYDFAKNVGSMAKDLKGIWGNKKGNDNLDKTASVMGSAVQKVFVVNMKGGGLGDYYEDDDPSGWRKKQLDNKNDPTDLQKTLPETRHELGRFRMAMGNARTGLNKFGSTLVGGTLLSVATTWAMNQIYNFGSAFMEWRRTVAEANQQNRKYVESQQKPFEERYGNAASKWSKKYDDALLALTEESNSFLPSQKRMDELAAEMNHYKSMMTQEIKNNANGATKEAYESSLRSQNINIYMDTSTGKATVETNGGKPPKVKTKSTIPGIG